MHCSSLKHVEWPTVGTIDRHCTGNRGCAQVYGRAQVLGGTLACRRPLMVHYLVYCRVIFTATDLLLISRDVIHGLVAVGQLPLSDPNLANSRKRRHSESSDMLFAEKRKPIVSDDLSRLPHGQLSFDPVPTGMDFAKWLSTGAPARTACSVSSMHCGSHYWEDTDEHQLK